MLRYDPLVGPFELPPKIERLMTTPEVQRLKDIRLLNICSPTFQALSEVRRLAHSLAVVALSERMKPRLSQRFDARDLDHWQVALLVHDMRTPPFGHLFEYRLSERWGWRHDSRLDDVVFGLYRPENANDQIYFGNSLELFHVLDELNIDIETVTQYLTGATPLGKLVSGTLDLDNIDNVFRMGLFFGWGSSRNDYLGLVDALDIEGDILTVDPRGLDAIESWRSIRRDVYRHLFFDAPTVSLQAMLTKAFEIAIDDGVLSPAHWRLTDDEILRMLSKHQKTKAIVKRVAVADYYQAVGLLWFDDSELHGQKLASTCALKELEAAVSKAAGTDVTAYAVLDRGTFSRRLEVRIGGFNNAGEVTQIGETSRSVLVGLFAGTRNSLPEVRHSKTLDAAREYLAHIGLYLELPQADFHRHHGEVYAQLPIAF